MGAEHSMMSKRLIVAMLAVLVTVTVVSMTVFQSTAINNIKTEARGLLSESAQDQSDALVGALKNGFSMLEAAALTVEPADPENGAAVAQTLARLETISDFFDICYASSAGASWSDGATGISVADREYFIRSMAGERAFECVLSRLDGERRFVLSVPVYNVAGSAVTGVIFGVCSEQVFGSLLDSTVYEGVLTLVFTGSGEYLTGSKGAAAYTGSSFEALGDSSSLAGDSEAARTVVEDFAAGRSGSAEYTVNGEKQYAVYSSVGFSDWMIWVNVPSKTLNAEAYETIAQGYALICVVVCTAAAFVLLIVGLYKKNTRLLLADQTLLRESEARYRIALEHTSVTIWDYDVLTHTITHDERSRAARGIPEAVIENVPESLIERGYVHPESAEPMREMYRRIEKGDRLVTGVFRIRTADGAGWWFEKVKYSCLADAHGKPYHAIGMGENVSEEQAERRRIVELNAAAECDSMTGIFNHDATIAHITEYLAGPGRNAKHALFMIDIDDFKRVNDTLGHQCGDETIKRIAQRIKSVFRASDIVGRVGGDEFMVLMQNMPDERLAQRKGAELVNALRLRVSSDNRSDMTVTASVGIAICAGDTPADFDSLYSRADSLLYRVKAGGKNSYCIGSA